MEHYVARKDVFKYVETIGMPVPRSVRDAGLLSALILPAVIMLSFVLRVWSFRNDP